jgi:hypothetical protein
MSEKISPPALHHVARTLQPTPELVAKALLDEVTGRPPFSYKLMDRLARIALTRDLSLAQFEAAVKKYQRNEQIQKIFLKVVPLLHDYFTQLKSKYRLPFEPLYYPINELAIPFRPPFAFELDGELVIPYPMYWKRNPLSDKQYSLLATMIREILDQHPDYRDAIVLILDFSAPPGQSERRLRVKNLAEIKNLKATELAQSLATWYKGYKLALEQVPNLPQKSRRTPRQPPAQKPLFDSPD